MNIEKIINNFFNENRIKLRKETIRYLNDQVKPILLFLKANKINDFNKLKYDHLLKFIENEKNKGNSNQTINKRIMIIKRLIKYAFKENQKNTKDLNYILNFEKLKSHSNSYIRLDNIQLNKLINYYNKININDFYKFRLKIIIGLLLSTGVRATELLFIKIENINLNERKIYLEHTKTEQPRVVYITNDLAKNIQNFISIYKINDFLICNIEKKPLNLNSLTCIFKRLSNKLKYSISPHKLRHTYASKQLENGMNIEALRKIMGHTNLKTTQIYLNLNDNFIKKEFDKTCIIK